MAVPINSTLTEPIASTSKLSPIKHAYKRTKTVAVMGAAYGGARAAKLLSEGLPADWKLIVIDRNSHFNHVYVFPRFTVIPEHAPKAYVPTVHHLKKPNADGSTPSTTPPLTPTSSVSSEIGPFDESDEMHRWVHGSITSLTSHSVTYTRPVPKENLSASSSSSSASAYEASFGVFEGPTETINFDYAVYALGAGLPDPVNVWKPAFGGATPEDAHLGVGTKRSGVRFMERKAESLKQAQRILIVGAGALGIQYATDLKSVYPNKEITLLHSRTRLMPIYPIEMHTTSSSEVSGFPITSCIHRLHTVIENLDRLGVETILGERVLTWPSNPECLDGEEKLVTTDKGRTFTADIVLPCTGQKPHVSAMAGLCPETISPLSGRIRVKPTMQVSRGPTRPAFTRDNTLERLDQLSLQPSEAESDKSAAGSAPVDEELEVKDDLSHLFAVGDCAETGAIQAGHTAYYQAEVAARNILKLVKADEGGEREELENYKVSIPAIKVTLGLTRGVISNAEGTKVSDEGVEDLHAMVMWPGFQADHMDVNE